MSAFTAVIAGGSLNEIDTAAFSFIGAGQQNKINAIESVIVGGRQNEIYGTYSCIVGGYTNKINTGSDYSSIGGGYSNEVTGDYVALGGGYDNTVSKNYSTLAGGRSCSVSGFTSFVGGGYNNQATNNYGVVCGGYSNQATGTYQAFVGGGKENLASNSYATVCAGKNNTSSGGYSFVGGGEYNQTTASYSAVVGGRYNEARKDYSSVVGLYGKASYYGEAVQASGRFAATGDAQRSMVVLRNTTADATTTSLYLDGSSQKQVVSANTSIVFTALVIGHTDGGSASGAYKLEGAVRRPGTGTPVLVGSVTKTVLGEDSAGFDANAVIDASTGALDIQVNGTAATNMKWVAKLDMVRTTG